MVDLPASPDIARRSFNVVRRGYEQQEVRGFLHEVSALVDRLQRAEQELRERAERAEAKLGVAEHPDESVLLEALGAETTRVLTSAHEAAADIRAKAEASVERIVAEATAEAARLRSSASQEAEALLTAARSESASILEQARGELELRTAEALEAVAHLREEGEAQAQARRDEGEAALARARAEVEAILDASRGEGRAMVAEAQAVREKVLRDLVARRKRARQQVEKLNAGRERLLQAYEVVRRTIDEATTELTVSLADARVAANAAARRVDDEPDTTLEEIDAEVSAAALLDLPVLELSELDADLDEDDEHDDRQHDDERDGPSPMSGEVPVVEAAPTAEGDTTVDATSADSGEAVTPAADPVPSVGDGQTSAPPTSLDDRRARKGRRRKGFDGLPPAELDVLAPPSPGEGVRIIPAPSSEPTTAEAHPDAERDVVTDVAPDEMDTSPVAGASADEESSSNADDVFARLRGEVEEGADESLDTEVQGAADEVVVAEPSDESGDGEGGDGGGDEDAGPFVARAEVVGPLEKDLAKALKRTLADEQNEVLDLLRRAKPNGVDDVLPDPDEHAARWAQAAAEALGTAASAGAGGAASLTSVADLATELGESLTVPLRERIDRGFVASDGNLDDIADRVRALYREWRGQRLHDAAGHYVAAAYARGLFDAIDEGTKVRWVIDPAAGACPDCDDNVLAGAVVKGEEFPTGNSSAPAHPGCHCLVLVSPT